MSDNASTGRADVPFAGLWAGYLGQADAQNKAWLECLRAFGDPQQMQKRWLEALSKNTDAYLRSPAFLGTMQRNLKAMTDLKAFQDQVVQDVARNIGLPLAGDIHGLFERLHSVEHAVLARLEAIEGRLATVETEPTADQGRR